MLRDAVKDSSVFLDCLSLVTGDHICLGALATAEQFARSAIMALINEREALAAGREKGEA